MTYYENRAVLRDNESDTEIEVRGGVEADDLPGGYEIRMRCGKCGSSTAMRVTDSVWKLFCREVGKL